MFILIFLLEKNIVYNFDVDYWGLSNKQSFEYILKNDKRNEIKLGSAGPISLKNSMDILTSNDANRLDIVDNSKADYIINNYRNWFGYVKEEYKIPDNFSIFKEIIIHGNKIVTIYKRDINFNFISIMLRSFYHCLEVQLYEDIE